MTCTIGSVEINVSVEENAIRLQTDFEHVFLENQTLTTAEPILQKNFEIVRKVVAPRITSELNNEEVDEVCLKIVLQHFCLYNKWKNFYAKERDRDLTFLTADLEKPMTYDIVIDYIKGKYKKNYRERAALTLGIELTKLTTYEKGREEFMARR